MIRWMSLLVYLCAAELLSVAAAGAAVTTERVASGLNRPIYCTAPAGDSQRLFIVEQRGVIKVLKNGQLLATPFLDIDALVTNISGNDERGLLGLVFHPDYDSNGFFYVNYTNLSSDTVIARYQVSGDPDVADPGSAAVILTIDQPFTNHNGGHLAFGPIDGYLYVGMGDGGSSGDPMGNGQRDDTLLGKMLRIDVDGAFPYAIPPDNPHVGPGDPLDEIWAKGVRNPYRFSFDRANGDLYIGEVGQGSREEVDYQPAASPGGENYGWRIMEGTSCFDPNTPPGCNDPSLTPPIHEYTHGGNPFRCSITGGYVYRGDTIPEIQGHYFFADWCSAQIWSFRVVGGQAVDLVDRTAELAPGGGLSITNIAGFGEDAAGELYIVDRDSSTGGEVFRIIPEVTSTRPTPAPPLAFAVSRALPNPFTTATQLELTLDTVGELDAAVYSASGRLLRTLRRGAAEPGRLTLTWDGRDVAGREVPSGVYFLRTTFDGRTLVRRVTVVR